MTPEEQAQQEADAQAAKLGEQLEQELAAREAELSPEPPSDAPPDVRLPPDALLPVPKSVAPPDKPLAAADDHAEMDRRLDAAQHNLPPDKPSEFQKRAHLHSTKWLENKTRRPVETIDGPPFKLDEHLDRTLDDVSQAGEPDQPPQQKAGTNRQHFPDPDRDEMRASAETEFRIADDDRWESVIDHLEALTERAAEHTLRIEYLTRYLERTRQ